MMKKIMVLGLLLCCLQHTWGQLPVYLPEAADAACNQWVNNTLSRMGLTERIGQLFVYSLDPSNDLQTRKTLSRVVKKCAPGGILFHKGNASEQAKLTNYIQSQSAIPALITFDGEWGVGSKLANMPEYPQNAALGCIEDNSLIEAYGREVARQLRELGVHINFAPVADINRNPDNPSINVRSFGADTKKVSEKVLAYSRGLQSGQVLPVLKHFPGQGDTKADGDITMPIIPYTRAHLDSVELYPYYEAIKAGIGGIMVGHLKFPAFDSDRSIGASFSPNIINGLLKNELGFKGLIFSEPLYRRNVSGTEKLEIKALKAGNDMIIVNGDLEKLQKEILAAVRNGEITEKEIEAKCRKILTYKYLLGLNNRPQAIQVNGLENRINTPAAQQLAVQLRVASVTVLGNYGDVLPLSNIAGDIAVVSFGKKGSDDYFMSSLHEYAKPIHYEVTTETTEEEWQRILSGLNNSRRIIVSITAGTGEAEPFLSRLNQIHTPVPLVYVFFSPYKEMLPLAGPLSRASVIVLAHSGQDDLRKHTADVIFGKAPSKGKLSMPLAGLFGTGTGVELTPGIPTAHIPEDYGMKSYIFHRGIDSIAQAGLRAGAFPGCQVLVLKNGRPVYDKSFGVRSDKDKTPVRPTDLFDLADLTQTTATLLAVMKLYDEGKLKLSDKVSQYVPALRSGNKRNITIGELLFHESGLAPNIRFHRETIDDNSVQGPFTQGWIDDWHYTRIGEYTWACSDFKFKKGIMSDVAQRTHQLQVADGMWLNNSFRNTMISAINNSPLDSKRYIYSPSGFILLQLAIENISGTSLDKYLEQVFYAPMNLVRTKYQPLRTLDRSEIIPTASNEYFRRQDIHGYVHDELAACQGGVSGNAGLFSTARDVALIHQMLLNGGELDGKRYISEETCKMFTTKKSAISRRGLGFDKPSTFDPAAPLANPCSPSTPLTAFGQTGFTGTGAWADPDNNLVYVFLSNRVCPDVWNDKIITMNIMQNIQELIYKSME